jgi:DNA-binding response OmpR family regulator
MSCIYFVEDNPHLLSDGLLWLKHEGLEAYGASSANEFEALINQRIPNLILLDWNLPEKDGLSIAKKLRSNSQTKDVYIIFVTARNAMDDRVAGLNLADAYITKPFDYRELLATIHAFLRRPVTSLLQTENSWRYSPQQHTISTPDGKSLTLTENENLLLQLFYQHPEKIITHQMISQAFQESLYTYEKNRVEVIVSRLRNKLKTGENNPIRSFRNKGYQLTIELNTINTNEAHLD